MYCSRCGFPNADEARFCEKCGMGLGSAPQGSGAPSAAAAPAAAPSPAPSWQPSQHPGAYTDPRLRGAAPYPSAPGERRYAVGKDPTAALLLSLFLPAIGQFYNGDTKKGLMILGGYFVSFILSFVYIGILTGLGLWIWSVIDAHNVASGKGPLW